MVDDVPDEVRRLAAERQQRRDQKDFAAADDLRDRIGALGYRVIDGSAGSTIERIAGERIRRRARDVPSVLDDPAIADVTVQWLVEDWPEDVVRALDAFRTIAGDRTIQYVVVDLTETDPSTYGPEVEVVPLELGTGWAAGRNAGLRRSVGRLVLVVDGSIEPTGDMLGPLESALADPSVGVAGPFGISTNDLRDFHESEGPDVDAIEGYLMAFRRDVIRDAGLFDEKFTWYRSADIELSFRLKDAGYRAVVVEVPVERHEHRVWASTSPSERERLSKRNFYRFLERFRDRFDLLVEPPARNG